MTSRSFEVRRLTDGDAVRSENPPDNNSIIRYGPLAPSGLDVFNLVSTPSGYDSVDLWWGTPPASLDWQYMVIVRSGFGHPVTPADGTIVYRVINSEELNPDYSGKYTDTPLSSGGWYYYSQLFKVANRWYRTSTTESLVPKDYAHSDVMYDQLPPFYQEVDGKPATGERRYFLKRWFETIGYDLDMTRTLVEGMDVIYDPDRSPLPLISALGQQNLGFNMDESSGAVRYRSVVAASRSIEASRGTYGGLEEYLSAALQYRVTTSPGNNLLLLRDDARFESGVGNWCPVHHGLAVAINNALPLDDITTVRHLSLSNTVIGTPEFTAPLPDDIPELVRGAHPVTTCLKITPADGESMAISCGVGQSATVRSTTNLVPSYRAHSVIPGRLYHLSFWTRSETAEEYRIAYGLAYYGKVAPKRGFSDAFSTGINSYLSVAPEDVDMDYMVVSSGESTGWTKHYVSMVVPEIVIPDPNPYNVQEVRFASPVIWIEDVAHPKYVAGVMFSLDTNDTVQAATHAPSYLRLSSSSDYQEIGLVDGKVLGEVAPHV